MKTFYEVCKIKYIYVWYLAINTEYAGPDLMLANGDPDVTTFYLGTSTSLSLRSFTLFSSERLCSSHSRQIVPEMRFCHSRNKLNDLINMSKCHLQCMDYLII
jgi:hypothetical protein